MFKDRILDALYAALKLVAEMPAHAAAHSAVEGLPWWLKAALGVMAFMAAIALPIVVELIDRSRNRQNPPTAQQQNPRKKRNSKK